MNQELNTKLKDLSSFYALNVGTLSQALWHEQESLGLSNKEVVAIITSLAQVKERIDTQISEIQALVNRKDASNPE